MYSSNLCEILMNHYGNSSLSVFHSLNHVSQIKDFPNGLIFICNYFPIYPGRCLGRIYWRKPEDLYLDMIILSECPTEGGKSYLLGLESPIPGDARLFPFDVLVKPGRKFNQGDKVKCTYALVLKDKTIPEIRDHLRQNFLLPSLSACNYDCDPLKLP